MPVTLTTSISGALTVAAIDANFEEIQEFLRERVLGSDLLDKLNRVHLNRYVGGRLVQSSLGDIRFLIGEDVPAGKGVFELNCKSPSSDTLASRDNEREQQMMEFLGKPGQTMWFQFQEDGLTNPVAQGAGLWTGGEEGNPTTGDYGRYPEDECYSHWLTVPHAALKIPVVEPAAIRITAQVTAQLPFSMIQAWLRELATGWPGANTFPAPPIGGPEAGQFYSDGPSVRFGLFIDTNPVINLLGFSPEFVNALPRIMKRNAGTGLFETATYRSWKKLNEKSVNVTLNITDWISHEVFVNGNSWYNISLKHRDANTHGYIDAVPNFITGDWEDAAGSGATYRFANPGPFGSPPFVCYWESSYVSAEIIYNRGSALIDDTAHSSMETAPKLT